MSPGEYSFIDIAVLDPVRERLAAGDALVILSANLDEVIWANGAGADLFGFAEIEAVIGASAGLGIAARRQIAATPGFPAIGRDRPLVLRLTRGMSSQAVAMLASAVTLPDGEAAILLAQPDMRHDSRSARELAERAIAGFAAEGHFAALVDANGAVRAASTGFEGVGIAADTLNALVAEVATEADRLVKRLIAAGQDRRIPAGIARLTDDPALHFLVVVDEDQDAEAAGHTRPQEQPGIPWQAGAGATGMTETGAAGAVAPEGGAEWAEAVPAEPNDAEGEAD